ncbi:DinB family protein [Niabella ginsengisoli]|uniref:DinB family protein n=1 Tax=Niabella ginsengisoli TaxID=522298 RepID=A0ABS9SPT4_9BACT|nr:DinB family protein [Niabella ginsengisoli]MCH5600403.1 DinB family protein [Niabella ginsengisoli]
MRFKHHIAQHLLDVHRGGNWTDVNITDTIKDISWQQAIAKTSFSPNSIAMLLHHISYWNRVVAQRGRGIVSTINKENGMNVPPITNENEWLLLKKDNLHSAGELETVIEGYDEGNLFSPILTGHTSAYKNFQGQVEHVHYHLGQIVMIKKYLEIRK